MKRATLLALAAGLVLFVTLLIRYGGVSLAAAVSAARWGLLWVAIYRFLTITTDALGWRALFVGSVRPTLGSLVRMRWIGESLNSLLPVAQVGGDVARALLATRLGVPGPEAGATVVVNFTLDLGTQILMR
ncbi:MAG TPA: lysylphosphatidylglycerol synthase domain-containing protein [Candidatus Acidoferrales bacterium]|nr:lysylphosphatidylglycerol synthase domain-containing protein [Candidatus Acidoferrales bacterium]